jgi:integrase
MRLWLLLCSDLGLRSGTAGRIGPEHYDTGSRTLRFVTKWGERLTLPVTEEIAAILDTLDMSSLDSFVRQLQRLRHPSAHTGRWPASGVHQAGQCDLPFRKLLKRVGITRHIVPHDLRRTAAVAMLEETGDIRDVQALLGHRSLQSTLWYLDHDIRPVQRGTLERIKNPTWGKEKTT